MYLCVWFVCGECVTARMVCICGVVMHVCLSLSLYAGAVVTVHLCICICVSVLNAHVCVGVCSMCVQ